MSFLGTAFSGASNQFNPTSGVPAGTQATIQNFAPQLATAQENYGQANTGLNTLAQALQAQMNGGGPNLAGAQLAQATQANVANQAALAAGQRGAASNVGLIQRQAANQGANIQQQAAGQAATNRLQQQLAAQSQLGSTLGTQGALALQNQGNVQGAQTAQNSAIIGGAQGQNQLQGQIAQNNASMNQGLLGGVLQAGAGALTHLADGGAVAGFGGLGGPGVAIDPSLQAGSNFGFNFTQGLPAKKKDPTSGMTNVIPQTEGIGGGNSALSAGESTPMPGMAMAARGGEMHMPFTPMDYRQGGDVTAQNPQQKATVPGNSLKNDKIPAMVSEGEVVIPRDVMQSKDPVGSAANFVAQIMAGKHRGKS